MALTAVIVFSLTHSSRRTRMKSNKSRTKYVFYVDSLQFINKMQLCKALRIMPGFHTHCCPVMWAICSNVPRNNWTTRPTPPPLLTKEPSTEPPPPTTTTTTQSPKKIEGSNQSGFEKFVENLLNNFVAFARN